MKVWVAFLGLAWVSFQEADVMVGEGPTAAVLTCTPILSALMGEAQGLKRPLGREGCPLEWELFSCLLKRACSCLNLLQFLPSASPLLGT